MSEELEQLIEMFLVLGDPARDYVILGEGNTSSQADGPRFLTAASVERIYQRPDEQAHRADLAR